jgi:hypothetical protein
MNGLFLFAKIKSEHLENMYGVDKILITVPLLTTSTDLHNTLDQLTTKQHSTN